ARNHLRKERRHLHELVSDDMMIEGLLTPENLMKQKRDSEFLWSVIETLEQGQREAVIAHLNGLQLEAIATALDIPLSTAAYRLRTAKETLREAFIKRDRPRARRGVLPLLAIDVLLDAERARIDAVPADAVVAAQAALDQTLSELGRGPSSGVRDASPREEAADPEQQRIARLLRKIRPFLTSVVLGALAVIGPWQGQAPGAAVAVTPSITREVTAAGVAPASGRPAEDSTAPAGTPRARLAPTLVQPVAGAHAGKRSAAPRSASPYSSSSSALSREKMEAGIRAVRRGDSSASGAMEGSSDELSPARRLLPRRAGRE
ncbi:MAG: RNA polymerase sigma factor, partial [Byssovorax sp.]